MANPSLTGPLTMGLAPVESVKPMINVGCLMDIPTGNIVLGMHGEAIINGGLSTFEGIAGPGNCGKSTVSNYRNIMAAYRMGSLSSSSTYDTEGNVHEWRIKQLISNYTNHQVDPDDWEYTGKWLITDKTKYKGEEWFNIFKAFCEMKRKDKKLLVETPFIARKTARGEQNTNMKMIVPTMVMIDSISRFGVSTTDDQLNSTAIGDSKANTADMNLGRYRSRLIGESSDITTASSTYMTTVTHIGKVIPMNVMEMPKKLLPGMKPGEKFTGVPPNYQYLTLNLWYLWHTTVLANGGDKSAEYPKYDEDRAKGCTDLNLLTVNLIRGKNGVSNHNIQIILSQREGILPSLSEFHYIRSHGYFGLVGSTQNYHVALYPEAKLQRTTVRAKIDSDKRLRRAINICSELLQMFDVWSARELGDKPLVDYFCTPEELYEDIKKLGYDWSVLLDTRGWWTLEGEHQGENFLSTIDLLRMRKGEYHPYWLEDDKKTIKKQYLSTDE